ncbi:type II secretion system F family protein [Pseudomonas citronellolis]|uniref:type II secretion system F family protein n=1 Tax=Pseudomonas citronellolis TaxID=53408 RepID=UPI00071899FE|nr:type II secretion system F family protein [Pseudomonas citronellolis]KRV74976.1 type II secretion system protein F [Pseudomonas citronellolis]KRW79712.1 type II secretion system protein F [Pseudomonas citronellolis]
MSAGALLLAVASLALVGLAVLLLGLGLRARNNEQVVRRLVPGQALGDLAAARPRTQHWLVRRMRRAGIVQMRPWLVGAGLAMLALAVPGWRLLNVFGVLLAVPLVLLLFNGLLGLLYQRRLQKMIRQMPAFLDQVVRSLQAGRTLGDAIEQAVAAADDPLRSIFARASSHVQLGISLPEALQDIAELYDVEELHILALGVTVNYRYGGNTTDLLDNIIKVIHEREKVGRQLRAMTGETRFSALVLAVLPLGLGMYILASNPGYLMAMWTDGFGRTLLLTSLGLQAVGCVTLWRMLKSV